MLPGNEYIMRTHANDPELKSREVRLGLVLYGGVSLAIYITGVTHEFYRMVRGRNVYRLLKALTDSDIVVDIISGTSAGGINGLALAYALCNKKDFGGIAELWREHGDIRRLLRTPAADTTPTASLFDGEGYYQQRLEEAFRKLDQTDEDQAGSVLGEDPSLVRELDLFITGTDVEGKTTMQIDDAGHPIAVKDHRAVFLLKHREGRKEPFNPRFRRNGAEGKPEITYQALAKLARITSCFPAAFPPVHVRQALPNDEPVDDKLQEWGRLGKEAYLIDGGVLDNNPFTHTIRMIFSRTANREVERKLFYVEPDPGEVKQKAPPPQPNFLQVIVAALTDIPSYQGITDDLKLLAEHNSKLQQYNRLVSKLQPEICKAGVQPRSHLDIIASHPIYQRSLQVAYSERILRGILQIDDQHAELTPQQRQQAAALMEEFDGLASNTIELLDRFDVGFRLRRVIRVVYEIYNQLYDSRSVEALSAERTEDYIRVWSVFNGQVELYEVLQAALERLIDEAPIAWQDRPPQEVWKTVFHALNRLVADDPVLHTRIPAVNLDRVGEQGRWLSSDQLEALNAELRERNKQLIKEITNKQVNAETSVNATSVLQRLDEAEQHMIEYLLPNPDDPIRRVYAHYIALDAQLFPLELMGRINEKDIIETIRISAQDAQRGFSVNSYSDKVSGDAVHHFGGFFKRSWRSNDILWGRLDGLCQLVETLLTKERVEQIVTSPQWRARVRNRLFHGSGVSSNDFKPALDPVELFPRAGAATHTALRQWLWALLSDSASEDDRATALEDKRFTCMVNLLIEAAQLEVIKEELPAVITDALVEQADWNRFQTAPVASTTPPTENAGPPWVFRHTERRFDPFVAFTAAAERMRDWIERLRHDPEPASRPAETQLGRFFCKQYHVGKEKLTSDVPTIVLLEILAVTLLVLRNCLLGVFGTSAQRIRRNPLYIFGVALPLRAFHALTVVARRAPGIGLAVFLGLAVICVLAIIVGSIWWSQIIWPTTGFDMRSFLVFIGAPAIILLVQVILLIWSGWWLGRRKQPIPTEVESQSSVVP